MTPSPVPWRRIIIYALGTDGLLETPECQIPTALRLLQVFRASQVVSLRFHLIRSLSEPLPLMIKYLLHLLPLYTGILADIIV
jgi:hypothetical protein